MCTEGLVNLFKEASREGTIRGFTAAKEGSRILHIFFADDSLICCKAKRDDYREVMKILTVYRLASGQEVNIDKLRIMFSRNTRESDRRTTKEVLGIQRSMEHDCYLGLPLLFGRSKAKELRCIKDMLWSRVQS